MPRSSGSLTAPSRCSPLRTNFETLRTFIASLRPIFIWPTSNAVSTPGPPRAAQYRTPSDPYSCRSDSGVTTLPLDFDIFLRSGSSTNPEMEALVHGAEWFSKCARTTDENSQVRMMSWACGRRSIGNVRENKSCVGFPRRHQLRRHRRGGPGIHDVGIARKAARLAALIGGVALGHVGGRIDRQSRFRRHDHIRVVDSAVGANRVPHRDRHAEETLAADAPVAVEALDPVLITGPHVFRMPADFLPTLDEVVAMVDGPDEPLAAGDDLERAIALLVKFHRVRDRLRLALQVAALAQQLDDFHLGLLGGEPRQLIVGALRARRVHGLPPRLSPRHRSECPVRLHDRPHRQLQLAPPRHVGGIAKGTNHRDAAALFRIGQRVRLDRHLHPEQRRHDFSPEERLVSCVIRMRHERHARRDQLGTRGLDGDRTRTIGFLEIDPVVRRWLLAILELGLRHRRAKVHVPQRRRFRLIRELLRQVAQEHHLRHALRGAADGRVSHRPVHRQPEIAPQLLEDFLVGDGQLLAQCDEVRARHGDRLLVWFLRRREIRVVRQRRIAAHAEIILHAALGGQAIVVPAHRIEHFLAAHALEARDEVGVRIGEDVADVQ